MPKAIRIHQTGGAEVMRYEDFDPGAPGEGEVQVRHTAIGLNYIDVYDRSGLYAMPLPGGLGREAAGVVVALGRKVKGFRKGDRVAYVHTQPGSYCEVRNLPASRLVKLPKSISDEQAAALMLKGLTAQYLLRRTYRVKRGDFILVHAAVGGVGLILCQWAKVLGAKVIGVVGSAAKAAIARKNGCAHVLVQGRDPIVDAVKKITKGKGVAVVYDSLGKDTFFESLDCLAPLGMMVSYGNATGPAPSFSPLELSKRGSLFITRPSLFAYIATRSDLDAAARETFRVIASGKVKLRINQKYALKDAAQAHRDLEARKTTGSTVLIPPSA
ncbi:MAG: quinone oxidoreductase [Gammaproteobacteria bacterium]|jgi:NADPH2:quinone reductase|nr:quinone oxidoreductase [Gammaproteobacteria bacterium]NBX40172.1 quinone oxidoreductase [Gammaproteobacteria bacterium]